MGSITYGPPREFVGELRRSLDIDTFVETGTFRGETARWAAGEFARVYTVERSQPLYQQAAEQLCEYSNIISEYDDTRAFLIKALANISAAIFWLDAHWSGGWETAGIDDQCPLLDELRILAPSLDRNVLLIDDARLFESPLPPPHKAEQWPNLEQILAAASAVRPIFYDVVDDVIVIAPAEFGSIVGPIIASYRKSSSAPIPGAAQSVRQISEGGCIALEAPDTYCLPSSLLAELLTELKRYSAAHKEALAAPRSNKFLLFSTEFCQGEHKRLVGGFADRLKGMLSCALLAILTDRIFLVEWVTPVALAEHFDSVNIGWGKIHALAGIDESDIFIADAIDWENLAAFEQYIDQSEEAGHLFGDRTLAKVHTNILCISNFLQKISLLRKTTFGCILERLLAEAPVPVVEKQLVRILFTFLLSYRPRRHALEFWNDFSARRREGSIIGVHFRSGGDGAWRDGTMDDVENASLVADRIGTVRELLFQDHPSVLITSDSVRFRADFRDLVANSYPVISYAGELSHYERGGGDRAGTDFAVLEFMCLSCCDYVIHGAGGFGVTAALIGGRSSSRYNAGIGGAEFGPPPGAALLYPAARARLEGLALGLWGEGVANRMAGPLARISWQVACRPGSYEVWVRYAAAEERPVELLLDGDPVTENALNETTGGWGPGHQQWRLQVRVQLKGPRHALQLTTAAATPHISALALVRRFEVSQHSVSRERRHQSTAATSTDQGVGRGPEHSTGQAAPFPEIFVINLDDRTDRWTAIQQRCADTGLTPIRVPAVKMSPAWLGCSYSHVKCVETAKDRNLPWVLILEDDATFSPESIHRFRELLPYLWENRDRWERFTGGPTFPHGSVIKIMDSQRQLMYARGFAAHFNLIHAGAYDEILKWRPDDGVIDVYYLTMESKFRVVFNSIATVPHISVQSNSPSDVAASLGFAEQDYSAMFAYSEWKLRECLEAQPPDELGFPPANALLYPAAHARLEGLALGLWGEGVANRVDGPTALISWEVDCWPGSYEVWVRYAAAEERPVKMLLDGDVVTENAVIGTTGGWQMGDQRWRRQVRIRLDGPRHTLQLAAAGATPHITALALVCQEAPRETGLSPGVTGVS
jgi:hypothetical protein